MALLGEIAVRRRPGHPTRASPTTRRPILDLRCGLRWGFVILALVVDLRLQSDVGEERGIGSPLEYKVKAAYLLNFCKLVHWPDEAHSSGQSPLVVGIVGRDPFGQLLDEVLGGELIEQHPVVVRKLQFGDDPSGCHVLFVCASETEHAGEILEAVEGRAVLTVGEMPGFGELGGMINLTTREGSIRFETNPGSAGQAGLRLSYKMIRLSRVVKTVVRKNEPVGPE